MRTEVLLTETEIGDEFAEALEARDLPEKFFYWSPHSVAAWLALSRDLAYESHVQGWNLLLNDIEKVARHLSSAVAVVSLGSGDGSKDVTLAKALDLAKFEVEYFAVDASQELLEKAVAMAEDADLDTWGIKADIASPVHLLLVADSSELPKLYLVTGNTLGGLDPIEQIQCLRDAMRPGDRLIIDAEVHDAAALSARDTATARRFAFAPLQNCGLTKDDGDVRFELKNDGRLEGLHLITRWFQVGRDLDVTLPGREILIQKGERISLNFNYTYEPGAFRRLLTQQGKLNILEESASPDGRIMTALCAR